MFQQMSEVVTGVIVKENQLVCMCVTLKVRAKMDVSCIATFSLTIALTALVSSLVSPYM